MPTQNAPVCPPPFVYALGPDPDKWAFHPSRDRADASEPEAAWDGLSNARRTV
jgi:hypothetical protein